MARSLLNPAVAYLFGIAACLLFPGCSSFHHWYCRGCDACAHRTPAASTIQMYEDGQTARADLSRFVINQHEWYKGGDELGPAGTQHLDKIIATVAATSPQPVSGGPGISPCVGPDFLLVLEPQQVFIEKDQSLDEATAAAKELDERRRTRLVTHLASAGIEDAEQRVLIAVPTAEGLHGVDSPVIYERLNGDTFVGLRASGLGQFGAGGLGGFGGGGFF